MKKEITLEDLIYDQNHENKIIETIKDLKKIIEQRKNNFEEKNKKKKID